MTLAGSAVSGFLLRAGRSSSHGESSLAMLGNWSCCRCCAAAILGVEQTSTAINVTIATFIGTSRLCALAGRYSFEFKMVPWQFQLSLCCLFLHVDVAVLLQQTNISFLTPVERHAHFPRAAEYFRILDRCLIGEMILTRPC